MPRRDYSTPGLERRIMRSFVPAHGERMMTRLSAIQWLAISLASLAVAASVQSADWSQWRGPHRDGHSADTGLSRQWPEGGPPLVWQVNNIGTGYSAPVVVEGRIYLLGNNGLDNEFVQA